jgi:glycosyltransferase involved in cell wall biosynthesis
MNVGIDVTPLSPIETGVDRYLLQLIHSLARIDSETRYTVFINAKDAGRFGGLGSNFSLLPIGVRGRAGRFIAQQAIVPALARSRRLDVLHSPSFFIPHFQGRAKHVVTIHDMTMFTLPSCHTRFRRSFPFLHGVSESIRRSHSVIVPSVFVRKEVARLLPDVSEEKIKVTPFGVDPEFQPADGVAFPPACVKDLLPYILFVGTIEPRKNLAMLLEAYRTACAINGLREHLVLVGRKGWGFGAVEKQIQTPELRFRVHAVGHVDRRKLLHFYQYASAFVCPSIEEGFGLSPLEAMACGIPTIATATSSLKENLSGAAMLVPCTSVSALADALLAVLSQPETRTELGRLGRARAHDFSWENTARKTLECYRELV